LASSRLAIAVGHRRPAPTIEGDELGDAATARLPHVTEGVAEHMRALADIDACLFETAGEYLVDAVAEQRTFVTDPESITVTAMAAHTHVAMDRCPGRRPEGNPARPGLAGDQGATLREVERVAHLH